jgi:DNA-binding protein HU-beta
MQGSKSFLVLFFKKEHSSFPEIRQVTGLGEDALCRSVYGDSHRMNTSELVDHVATSAGLEKAQARKAIDAVTSAIMAAAKSGDSVALAGFGQFKVKDTPARQGRNPATGQTIEIAAARKLTFAPAKAVKDALNG